MPGYQMHLAFKSEDDIQQLTPTPEKNTQGLGEQMNYSNEVRKRKEKNVYSNKKYLILQCLHT